MEASDFDYLKGLLEFSQTDVIALIGVNIFGKIHNLVLREIES